jgi:hypothetical protein
VSKLLEAEYDYVIIAVGETRIVEAIEKDLITYGISKEKIAKMDAALINENALPEEWV